MSIKYKSKGGVWKWILGILAICGIGFMFFKKLKNKMPKPTTTK